MKRSLHFTSRPYSGLIVWNKSVDEPYLLRDLPIGNNLDATICWIIIDIIHDNGGSFFKRGISIPIFAFEFYIDTGNSPPVCCRQIVYGFYESKIITNFIAALEASDVITDYDGA